MKKLVYVFSALMLIGAVSCASLSSLITPATIDKKAVKYASDAGVIDAKDFEGYGNLDKADRLVKAVWDAHKTIDLRLTHEIEENNLTVMVLDEAVVSNRKEAIEREENIFGPSGFLTLGLTALGVGPLAGIIGLMRKRPGDWTPQEMEATLGEVKGEVSQKDKNIIEIVKGVQKVLETCDKENADIYKKILAMAQSSDTKELIAKIKTTL